MWYEDSAYFCSQFPGRHTRAGTLIHPRQGGEDGDADHQHPASANGELVRHLRDLAPERRLELLHVALDAGLELLHVALERRDIGLGGKVVRDDRRQDLGLRPGLFLGETGGLKFLGVRQRVESQGHTGY